MSEAIRKPNRTMPESHSPDMPKFLNMMAQAQAKSIEEKEKRADKINVELPTKNTFDFKIQYSNLSNMSFVNCFAAAYVYLEGIAVEVPMKCGNGMCFGCGCGKETQSLYACLFYTMCGNSAVQRHLDEVPTKMAELIGYKGGWNGNCYTDYTVDFLFGFAGYDYRKITDADMFKHEIVVSINMGRPVIAELTNGQFRVITGYDNDTLIADYVINGQRLDKPPMPAPSYDELRTLYIIGDKITPRYTLKDGLERIKQVMENNIEEKIWDKSIEAITKAFISSTDDEYVQMNANELKMLQSRIHGMIENYHNRHTFSVAFTSWWQRLVADEQDLQSHVPIKFSQSQWQNVYSLGADEYIQGFEPGHRIIAELQKHNLAPCGTPENTFCESNGRNGIIVDKRLNGWDGIDICLSDMNLVPGNYCLIEVSGRFASGSRDLYPHGDVGLVTLPSYKKLVNHEISNGEKFVLSHTFPIKTGTEICNVRISTNDEAKNASFIINDINVSVKPLPVNFRIMEELTDLWRLMDVYSDRIRNYTHSVGRYAYHIGSYRVAYGRMFVTILEDIQNIHTEMLALINQAIEVLDNPTV